MAKSIICFFILINSTIAFSQNISDFKYVIIPDSFSDFEDNQYRMNYHLMKLLTEKKYEVLKSNSAEWPQEVKENACLALTADLIRGKKFLKNKVNVVFTDCQGKEIENMEGISNEKEYAIGYPDALKNAVNMLRISYPKELDYQPQTVPVIPVSNPEINLQGNISENSWIESGIEFTNGSQSVILTEQKDGSFILIDKKNTSIIGQLKPSSKAGIFHVTISDPNGNYHTIGFYDQNTLGIEYKVSPDHYSLTEFKKTN